MNEAASSTVRTMTVVCLATAAVVTATGCAGSPPAGGDAGSPGQAGGGGSGGAALGGNGSTPTAGSTATGGNAATGGTASAGGPTTPGGQAGSGGLGGSSGAGNTTSGGAGAGGGGAGGGGDAGGGGGAPTASACSPARPHAAGTSTVMLQSSGTSRSYLLHIPPGYDGMKPLPLVFDVHGFTSFASEQLMRSKWDKMADKEGFVLIDPDGIDKSWNAGSCCGGNKQDDVKFFRDMVAKASADLCIDSRRVYVSGHSNGGAMTYRLACEAADIFAAVAPVCGWMATNTCNPSRPTPVLAIRGLNDTTVTINTADSDVDEWLSNDQCVESQVASSGVCKTYGSCAGGTQVMDCRPRGNHNFFYASNPDNYLVPDNAWPFFKKFSLP